MSAPNATPERAAADSRRDAILPALLALLAGALVVVWRPPLPLDEIRYLEILRESLRGGIWLLELGGEPYADKPPLLFWLARAAGLLGLPPEIALRLSPALASAGVVAIAGALGRRLGLRLAGWTQAVLFLGFVYSQYVLFDPLLALGVWAAVLAWARGKDGAAAAAAALAGLAKGPVAFLHLAAFLWAFAPARPRREGAWRRGAAILGAGLLPLAGWALLAARAGGEEFAHELLWDRWAGRIGGSFAHRRPFLFYVPILLVGSLPFLPLLVAGRLPERRPAPLRRLPGALLALLVAFSAMGGKKPHYLLPLAPALALLAAERIERTERGPRLARAGIAALIVLGLLGLAAEPLYESWLHERYGELAAGLLAGAAWRILHSAAILLSASALVALLGGRPSLSRSLGAGLLALAATFAPLHYAAGRLSFPFTLRRHLEGIPAAAPLVLLGERRAGFWEWLARRSPLPRLSSPAEARPWAEEHPGGYLILDERIPSAELAPFLRCLAADRLRGNPVGLFVAEG
ncbi:MAG: phospholipid carrier-dependent glycosyltransferase [Planctomycetota bacterium]